MGKRFMLLIMLMLLSSTIGTSHINNSSQRLDFRVIADGVWLHTSYFSYADGSTFPSNGLVVKNGQELILIDTAWGEKQTKNLLSIIESEIGLPVTKAIVTHAHDDRVAGIPILKAKGIEVFAHPLSKLLALQHRLPVPDATLDSLATRGASVNFENLMVFFPGAAHSPDNIMIWLDDQKVLFGGCAVRALEASSLGNTTHADLVSWGSIMHSFDKYYEDSTLIVPGHGEPGGVELIEHTKMLLRNAAG